MGPSDAVLGALGDLRTIARSVAVLPDVARALTAIQGRVDSLDDEVRKIGRAVESMDGELRETKESVRPLAASLDELQMTVHPLRRTARGIGRLWGRGAGGDAPAQLPEDPAAPTGT